MKTWASKIKRVIKEQGRRKNINLAIVTNNHYAGFGPGTANIFRKMVGILFITFAFSSSRSLLSLSYLCSTNGSHYWQFQGV